MKIARRARRARVLLASTRLRSDFAAGCRGVAPVLLGIAPFALIVGAAAVKSGLSAVTAGVLSLVVFAGASQLAAIALIQAGAPIVVVLLTVFFINLRFSMYSASLAPYFRRLAHGRRLLIAYLLNDQDYMLSLYAFGQRRNLRSRVAFYLGVGLPLWLVWQLATLAGAVLGARLPPQANLDFAISLTFLAMLVPAVRDRASAAAAVAGGSVAVLAHGLPWNLGLILGALAGIGAGMASARRQSPARSS